MGRQSDCVQKACDRDGCQPKDLRYSTISVSLKRALRSNEEDLLSRFRSVSDTIGILQHVASLIVNHALCRDPTLIRDFKSFKTVFDRGMTASEIALGLKAESRKNKENPFA